MVRSGSLTQLTRDHSYVGRLVESGLISRDEAEFHPQRHILTAAFGTIGELVTDSPEAPFPLQPGDTLILCTDGLWGQVRDEELASIAKNPSRKSAMNLSNLRASGAAPTTSRWKSSAGRSEPLISRLLAEPARVPQFGLKLVSRTATPCTRPSPVSLQTSSTS